MCVQAQHMKFLNASHCVEHARESLARGGDAPKESIQQGDGGGERHTAMRKTAQEASCSSSSSSKRVKERAEAIYKMRMKKVDMQKWRARRKH